MNRIRRTLTRSNLKWVARTNLQSWAIQGVLVGLLTVVGVGSLAAMVSAKCAAWTCFICQCVTAARSK